MWLGLAEGNRRKDAAAAGGELDEEGGSRRDIGEAQRGPTPFVRMCVQSVVDGGRRRGDRTWRQ